MRSLPYPGFSWSFTQHAIGLDPRTIFDMLQCAEPFEGQSQGYNHKITQLMVTAGVLTPNERGGQEDAWRDYQQLLAELGLIYSTRICPTLTITDWGRMYLAGEVSFTDLMNVQCLRYQYPNGQKSTIQSGLNSTLEGSGIKPPNTLTELQVNNGILLKPGTLILRVLLELVAAGYENKLTVAECTSFLIPCKVNSDWVAALAEVIDSRRTGFINNDVNRHARRNVQDWFKFLKCSDYFSGEDNSTIQLSKNSIKNISNLNFICSDQEEISGYWIPTGFKIEDRMEWFSYFGNQGDFEESILQYENHKGKNDDIEADEINIDFEDDDKISFENKNVNLKPLNLDYLARNTILSDDVDYVRIAKNLKSGAQQRHAKTLLHDKIIRELAEKFLTQGATVSSDPDTVDLFSHWPDGSQALFEIKTVTNRSLPLRLRTAIGQIEEYSFRRNLDNQTTADKVVVLNMEITKDAWQRSFLTEHLKIGLICKIPKGFVGYAPENANSKRFWT